jgi:acyl transferase domain-containing protein
MFSGQGSQYYHMGRDLFETEPTFRSSMLAMDRIVHDIAGYSVLEQLYSDRHNRSEPLDDMRISHPGIFMVEHALATWMTQKLGPPHRLLGYSLGSFAATVAAGVLQPEQALSLIVQQALCLEERCEPGGMIAVLHDLNRLHEGNTPLGCQIASYNYKEHFVLSAPRPILLAAQATLTQRNILSQRLPISLPFHSQWIDAGEKDCLAAMQGIHMQRPQIHISCCRSSQSLTTLSPDYFWRVARDPVFFERTIEMLEHEGPWLYIDLGPSGTLATFLKYILPATSRSQYAGILSPFGSAWPLHLGQK